MTDRQALVRRLRALGYRAAVRGKEVLTNAPDRRGLAEGLCLVPYEACDQGVMFPRTPAWPGFTSARARALDLSPSSAPCAGEPLDEIVGRVFREVT
jgi:hypothetical protein